MKVTAVFLIVSAFVIVCCLAEPTRPRIRAISNSDSRSKIDTGFKNEGRSRSRTNEPTRSRINEPTRTRNSEPTNTRISETARSRAETRLREARPKVDARPKVEPRPKVEVKPKVEPKPVRIEEIPTIEDRSFDEPSPRTEATPIIENNPNLIVTEQNSPKAERSPIIDDAFGNTLETAPANTPNCQQNDLLNRLLLQVLLNSMVTTTTQNPLMENLNRLFNINPSPAAAKPTTVITSTAVSTITQLFSTIVSVMLRDRRIPTTIYSSSTLVVTEIQTVTSTLSGLEPSALFRFKRADAVENQLQSSILESSNISKSIIQPTQPLSSIEVINSRDPIEPAIDMDRLMAALNHPEIRDAWDKFLNVLYRVIT